MTWENRLTFEVSSADPDSATPVWVDLTTRILDAVQSVTSQSGRQNDLDQSEPGRLDLLLDNSDDALTYGNTASPYPWWGPGRKCRLRETVGGVVLDRFTGYLQVPNEGLVTSGIEQRVAVTAVDRLGRLASGEPFVSTLTEHIQYNGGSALLAHWPLNDPSGAVVGTSLVAGVGPMQQVTSYNDGIVNNQLLWGSRTGPLGDDVRYVQYNPTANVIANNYIGKPRLARRDVNVPFAAGQIVAILAWVYVPLDPSAFGAAGPFQILVSHANNFFNPTFSFRGDGGTGWTFSVTTNTGSTSAIVPVIKLDGWSLVGMFFDVSSGTATLRVDGQVATNTFGLASTGTLQEIALDGLVGHSWGQVQMYAGAPDQLNAAFFAAQFQAGQTGLERQPTGDRIRTIAQYAGVPAAELTQIDTGTSVMQAATLAGKTPLTAMRDAERTEQGLLYVDGSGNLVFKDRRTLYNI